jgi:Flp pilus assembly pilin Flp
MRPFITTQLALVNLAERLRDLPRSAKERGASAVEYALLIALIAAVIVVAVWALGQFVLGAFHNTCASVDAKVSASGGCTVS